MRILLDNLPANGYPPGSTITGRVIISADDRINIRSKSNFIIEVLIDTN